MHRLKIFAVFIIFLINCSEPRKAEQTELTNEQKAEIESFSHKLIHSINGFDFSVINSAWNNETFKNRISNHVTRTQKSVLTHIFEKDLKGKIKSGNSTIVLRVNTEHGKVSFLNLSHFDSYSELLLLLTFDGTYDFIKYRIEFIDNAPGLTDFYSHTDNRWYSDKVIDMLRLNSKYDAFSSERHQANAAITASEKALALGDTLEALYSLYDIPKTHQEGNGLSLRRLNLAVTLGDSVLAEVMASEHQTNKSLYMNYLYNYYFADTAELSVTYELLASELGESAVLDSLIKAGYLWNLKKNDNTGL